MGRGGGWGAETQELWAHWMEGVPLQRQREVGMLNSVQRDHQNEQPSGNLLGGLASRNLLHGRTGAAQRHGRWGTKEFGGAWQTPAGIRTPGRWFLQSLPGADRLGQPTI